MELTKQFVVWDVLTMIKDHIKPVFVLVVDNEIDNVYTFEELATDNIRNQYIVKKWCVRFDTRKCQSTYILDCEVV